jgi:hypothetical protein
MIARQAENELQKRWTNGKVAVILGARQTGKSTLVKGILPEDDSTLYLTGDDPAAQRMLEGISLENLKNRFSAYRCIFIDEAQRIRDIGLIAKMIADHLPETRLILTGSSALELAEGTYESLTGRKREFRLHPVSWQELSNYRGKMRAFDDLANRLVFGMYPEVITSTGQETEVLRELAGSYLYRDLLHYRGLRKPKLLEKITQALAWQCGQEVSFTELGQLVGADKATVETYIELLEKAFIVFRLNPYSGNLRNEIRKFSKVYFWDNGIRNAVIGQYAPLSLRNDTGQLFENFMIAERLKFLSNSNSQASGNFWRNTRQQEIDYLETEGNILRAWEIKYNPNARFRTPPSFEAAYGIKPELIHRDNFDSWLNG